MAGLICDKSFPFVSFRFRRRHPCRVRIRIHSLLLMLLKNVIIKLEDRLLNRVAGNYGPHAMPLDSASFNFSEQFHDLYLF